MKGEKGLERFINQKELFLDNEKRDEGIFDYINWLASFIEFCNP